MGEAIPYASIYVQHTSTGTAADHDGHYKLRLEPGEFVLIIHALGYEEVLLSVHMTERNQVLPITMKTTSDEMNTVEVYANKRDIAKEVMENARSMRKSYLERTANLDYTMVMKLSLVNEARDTAGDHAAKADSNWVKIKTKDRPIVLKQRKLIESFSHITSSAPSQFNERVVGFQDYTDQKPFDNYGGNISIEVGEHDIVPQQFDNHDPYVLRSSIGFQEFDINHTLLDIPALSEKKILSPLAPTAPLNYTFDLEAIFFQENKKFYRIKIHPIFPGEALFFGSLVIADSSWAVTELDLDVNPAALLFYKNFHFVQHYSEIEDGTFVPTSREMSYVISEAGLKLFGNVTITNSNFLFPSSWPQQTFSDESIVYEDEAFDRDSLYWTLIRTSELSDLEKKYIHTCDSLQRFYKSEDYYEERDSSINDLKFLDFILYGVGYANHKKGISMYFNPLVMQLNPVGIGGYRHRLGGTLKKEFENAYLLELEGDVDYGFRNQDIRGKVGVGLTYIPKKFVRTFIRVGDYYDMINTYASLGSIFSRSNYVRSQTISVSQRMELVNGLFAELTIDYSDQKPINNIQLDSWSSELFGSVNKPLDFNRYTKTEFRLDVKYYFRQKYMIKKGRKILLGSKYPEFNMTYRKGVPGLFRSEVDFDYIELGVRHSTELGRWGSSDWSVLGGSFINKTNLRILEYRYFRGSDAFFFSDPTRSFQLLGPTLSTANAFYRANYFHHFNGILLNKVPLLRRLKLTEAAGAGTLVIPSQHFRHAEMYLGIERVVQIRDELFRFGIYGATADNNLSKVRLEWKIGVNFYNTVTKKWSY